MTYLVEFPVDGGGNLLVQACADELPGGLELAALRPGEVVARAGESLERALETVKPALRAVADGLRGLAPDELAVEFGIELNAESGVVIAKGGADVHFTVTLSWKRSDETKEAVATVPTDAAGEHG